MQNRSFLKCLLAFVVAFAMLSSNRAANAVVVLNGGGISLVQEGPAAAAAGGLAPANLATAGTAFALDELGGFGHLTVEANDGVYGNASSWIGGGATGTSGPFIGINLGSEPTAIASIAFGRSNVLSGDPCAGGVCADRNLGVYTLQFTSEANPSAATADASWTTISTLNYVSAGGTNFASPHQRHLYEFNAVNATGLRLIVPGSGLGGGTAIDEIELYAPAAPGLRLVEIGPVAAAAGDPVPANLATNAGATAFAKNVFANGTNPTHTIAHLNDGQYGNGFSWIGINDGAETFAGVDLGTQTIIDHIAWGRSNVLSGDPCAGGVCTDRTGGTYTVQFTTAANPDELTDDSLWTTIGIITYDGVVDNDSLRHLYEFDAVSATGVRIVVSDSTIAIDEIEVFAADVPEPASAALLVMSLAGLGCRRRRRTA